MLLKICLSYKNIFRRGKILITHVGKRNVNWQGDDFISKNRAKTSVNV